MTDANSTSAYATPQEAAEDILTRVGKHVILGLPLGLGKANHIANALYDRAAQDPSIELTIYSALTLEVPKEGNSLEARFVTPLLQRLCGNYPALSYAGAQARGMLPDNIHVHEFFLPAGRRLNAPHVQQSYLSANYTHITAHLLDAGVNVLAQLVAARGQGVNARYSLSCNTDLTLDFLERMDRRAGETPFMLVGQVNDQLPFMPGLGDLPTSAFSGILNTPETQFDLFSLPKQPVTLNDYATALHVAALIKDGGTLQIGIGSFADALTHALKLRHGTPDLFNEMISALIDGEAVLQSERAPFEVGLYGSSEMLVEGLLELRKAGIIKRAANAYLPNADDPGPLIHGGFFLGSRSFYRELREMSDEDLAQIQMMPISFVNDLFGDEHLKRAQRRDARFVNNALMATLMGAVTSDALEDGRVVSGVGGQYNFVAQAHELEGARSIITVKAVRESRGRATSNIVWSYGHTTIPRHLRDIVVTEYGIADLRGKSDRDCIAAMLNIVDSRFQDRLLATAKKAGKIEKGYVVPDAHRGNTPERIAADLSPRCDAGHLPHFPIGTEMTETEQRLVHALTHLKGHAHDKPRLIWHAARTWRGAPPTFGESEALERMNLTAPDDIQNKITRYALLWALRETTDT